MLDKHSLLPLGAIVLSALVGASPTLPEPAAAVAGNEFPLMTPSPAAWEPTRTSKGRRGLISDAASVVDGLPSDISSLGSAAGSVITSGFSAEIGFLTGFPDGSAVQSSLGLNDDDVKALPTQVLNIPNYANWTNQGWNMRFRANFYKQPNISTSKLNDLANGFLIGTSIQSLPPPEQTQARNLTAEIYIIQQGNVNATFQLVPSPSQGASGEPGGGGASTPAGGNQTVIYPVPATDEGDIDGFVVINSTGLSPGNTTAPIQRLNVYANGTDSGNATSFLVPTNGLTVISDIDDILRVTKIWSPKEGIFNTFAAPFTPWMNMPDIYANWSRSISDLHFHYLTTTPEQITRNYMDFIYSHYPGGSFDTRPLNFSDVSATLSIRMYLLTRIFETFPQRKFVLVGDVSNSDIMKDYPMLLSTYPNQVSCILLRNDSNTDSSFDFPYDTSGFKGLNTNAYMFFSVPDDLTNIDIANGGCVNKTITENVTFGYQNLPLGIGNNSAADRRSNALGVIGWAVLVGLAVCFL